jgi:hypothetical protein
MPNTEEQKSSFAKATEDKEKRLHKKAIKEAQEFKKQLAERTLKLVTSGFGLVAALAWNELIKEFVKEYIKPLFGELSGMISLFIYAVLITALAVFVTYQLSKFAEKK